MKGFSGFPKGKLRLTQMPNLFFSELLPIIDNIAELKVTLYAFWALSQKEGQVRFMRLADFLSDPAFIKGLGATTELATDALLDGVERAVARGTFLHVNVESADGKMDLYFMNTERGRAAIDGITKGEWRPEFYEGEAITLLLERPNIFVLYEQNIGVLTPMMADELRDTEKNYPIEWIQEAIQIAVQSNVRKWRYIIRILNGWRQEGKQDGISRKNYRKNDRKPIFEGRKDVTER